MGNSSASVKGEVFEGERAMLNRVTQAQVTRTREEFEKNPVKFIKHEIGKAAARNPYFASYANSLAQEARHDFRDKDGEPNQAIYERVLGITMQVLRVLELAAIEGGPDSAREILDAVPHSTSNAALSEARCELERISGRPIK